MKKTSDNGYQFWKTENPRDEYQYNISFYPGFRLFNLEWGPASYFNDKYYIQTTLSTLLSIVAFIVWCFVGLNAWAWLLLIPFFVGWGQLYIHIPFIRSGIIDCEYPIYGVYLYGEGMKYWFDNIVFCLGAKIDKQWNSYNGRSVRKFFYMPWSYTWHSTKVLLKDGTWGVDGAKKTGLDKFDKYSPLNKPLIWSDKYPYSYKLKSGIVQERIATITVSVMEWRPRFTFKLPIFRKIRKSIDVSFNHEVGERTGSWKGGTVGCGYEMLKDETPEQTLRRMEKERKFR